MYKALNFLFFVRSEFSLIRFYEILLFSGLPYLTVKYHPIGQLLNAKMLLDLEWSLLSKSGFPSVSPAVRSSSPNPIDSYIEQLFHLYLIRRLLCWHSTR